MEKTVGEKISSVIVIIVIVLIVTSILILFVRYSIFIEPYIREDWKIVYTDGTVEEFIGLKHKEYGLKYFIVRDANEKEIKRIHNTAIQSASRTKRYNLKWEKK